MKSYYDGFFSSSLLREKNVSGGFGMLESSSVDSVSSNKFLVW